MSEIQKYETNFFVYFRSFTSGYVSLEDTSTQIPPMLRYLLGSLEFLDSSEINS